MRLFYALWPDEAVLRALERTQVALRGAGSGRFTRRERLHVTLHFLGERGAEGVQPAMEALEAAAGGGSLPLSLGPIGTFGREGTLYASVCDETGRLRALAEALGARHYVPHITLARNYRGDFAHVQVPEAAWTAREAHLVESRLGRAAQYSILHTVRW